jgi:YidC/Oxa1 family membrane protein insertase
MKRKKIVLILLLAVLLTTGCVDPLKNENKKPVVYEKTGQQLTRNILCQPENEEIRKLYEENNVDINKLPKCEELKLTSGVKQGIWDGIFVVPLSYLIIKVGALVNNAGIGLIIASILIKLFLLPFTLKSTKSTEKLKKVRPQQMKIEEKYLGKTDKESLMKKQQEIALLYKKNDIKLAAGCLIPILQIPLLFAFYEAIARNPRLFEGNLWRLELGITPARAVSQGSYLYLIITVIVALTTFFSFKNTQTKAPTTDPVIKAQQKQMDMTMNIFLVLIVLASYRFSVALSLYWVTSNLFNVVQQKIVKKLVIDRE